MIIKTRVDHFRFGSIFIKKKSNQTEIFFKKNRNRTKTGSNQPVSVRFFRTKTGSNRFGSVFSVLARFFRFGSVFFSLGSVRFDFLGFRLIKPKLNRTGYFFQNSNRFIGFFSRLLFFFRFSRFHRFFSFFAHPK